MYTTQHAIDIAKDLEPRLAAEGYHVAIGGSLVYRGTSEKDIDIFIYPHRHQVPMNLVRLVVMLETWGYFARKKDNQSTVVPDVWTAVNAAGQNVDFFFMSRVDRNPSTQP